MGLAAPEMPNYFHFLGPNSPVGNGPVLIAIERQADYMLTLCDRWQTENIHSFTPKEEALSDFTKYAEDYMKATVFSGECRSWYKSNSKSGRISVLWPGSTLHYLEAINEPRWDDWNVSIDSSFGSDTLLTLPLSSRFDMWAIDSRGLVMVYHIPSSIQKVILAITFEPLMMTCLSVGKCAGNA